MENLIIHNVAQAKYILSYTLARTTPRALVSITSEKVLLTKLIYDYYHTNLRKLKYGYMVNLTKLKFLKKQNHDDFFKNYWRSLKNHNGLTYNSCGMKKS